ncbi:ABC transporter ATP-binding protein [Patiriisocius hiemis]|uniref:ABC transporter ATP-binding protein n=1 Tax=Patiriisocius hiemis TaxID=3075604 RepID=A0ABU2YBR8_9FLAO|nr:ABC transporter ATP-binding protein [Constantimarinum sp. W242]MDT0555635.1 ABC transporter ATP-binding protein [Constantimarinum sp. W242]
MLNATISSFSYPDSKTVLKEVSFKLEKGEHLAILGESGCGKSTLLHLLYGLLQLEEGEIIWNGKPLLGPASNLVPGESFMKLVAQEFNIMPFTSVAENVAEYLNRVNPEKDNQRVNELLDALELKDFRNTKVKLLSGGQKQRVALAKALAKTPDVLLLDEPFSNIDTFKKRNLRRKLFKYLKESNCTIITATHDAEEALQFSDKLLVLKEGGVKAYGKTKDVYKNSNTPYLAGFFGDFSVLPNAVIGISNSLETKIVFAHQLVISNEKTPLKVIIKNSYFKGANYLIEASYKDSIVYFNSPSILKKETVYLRYINDYES